MKLTEEEDVEVYDHHNDNDHMQFKENDVVEDTEWINWNEKITMEVFFQIISFIVLNIC